MSAESLNLTKLHSTGQYVVLFFYPLDFTFVCPTEIIAFNDRVAEFKKINTVVNISEIGVSRSSILLRM